MRRRRIIVASICTSMAVLVLAYVAGSDFWHITFSAFLATLAGLLVGIPVALFMLSEEHRSEQRAADTEAEERKHEVLVAIHSELCENRADLAARASTGPEGVVRTLKLPALSVGVWEAMKASGLVGYLSADPGLLAVIARAYRFVEQTRMMESHWNERGHMDNVQLNPKISEGMVRLDVDAIGEMSRAIESIELADSTLAGCQPMP